MHSSMNTLVAELDATKHEVTKLVYMNDRLRQKNTELNSENKRLRGIIDRNQGKPYGADDPDVIDKYVRYFGADDPDVTVKYVRRFLDVAGNNFSEVWIPIIALSGWDRPTAEKFYKDYLSELTAESG